MSKDQKFFPKGKQAMTDSKTTAPAKTQEGFWRSLIPQTVKNRNDKAKIDSATDLEKSKTGLGEARIGFEKTKNRLRNIDLILDIDDENMLADHEEAQMRKEEAAAGRLQAQRTAKVSSIDDDILFTNRSIELQEAKEKLDRILNPKPALPYSEPEPEPDDPVSRMKRELEKEEEIIKFQTEMLAKAVKMRADGAPEQEVENFIDSLEAAIARERRNRD